MGDNSKEVGIHILGGGKQVEISSSGENCSNVKEAVQTESGRIMHSKYDGRIRCN